MIKEMNVKDREQVKEILLAAFAEDFELSEEMAFKIVEEFMNCFIEKNGTVVCRE